MVDHDQLWLNLLPRFSSWERDTSCMFLCCTVKSNLLAENTFSHLWQAINLNKSGSWLSFNQFCQIDFNILSCGHNISMLRDYYEQNTWKHASPSISKFTWTWQLSRWTAAWTFLPCWNVCKKEALSIILLVKMQREIMGGCLLDNPCLYKNTCRYLIFKTRAFIVSVMIYGLTTA